MKSQFYHYRSDKTSPWEERETKKNREIIEKIREIGADKYWISYLLLHSKSSQNLVV